MDELIIRSLMGETTAEEERQLIRWRAATPDNDARYRSLSATWELAGHAWEPERHDPPPARLIVERAEREAREARMRRGPPGRAEANASGRQRRRVGRFLAAASLAGAALAGTLWWSTGNVPDDSAAPYTIAAEQPRTVHLADGSAVHLAAGSALEIDPRQPRTVRLEGRAYFGIARQAGELFVVDTDAGDTRVLGTRFDVTARDGDLTVVVVEGRVEVVSDSGEVELGPGEQSRIDDGGRPVVGRADLTAVTEWLGPVFIFQDTPLTAVAAELQERFDRTVNIEAPELRDRTVTAVFADDSLEIILAALCRAVDAECVVAPDAVRFTL